jgi:ABC-type transport system involved in cytochrome c biogenesis permease subunit
MNESRLKHLPVLCVGVFAAWLLAGLRTPPSASSMDIPGFGRLPALEGGRIKPLDTIARTSLLLLRGKQTIRDGGRVIGAEEWLLNMVYQPARADALPVFEIDDPDVLGVMGIEQTANRYYRFADLKSHLPEIESQARQAEEARPEQRSRYQTAISNLQDRLVLYQKLQNTLQTPGHDHVSDDVRMFAEKFGPILMTHMAKGQKPSKKLLEVLQTAQQYDLLRQAADFFPVPGSRGMTRLEWTSMGQGILDSMTAVGVPPPVAAYAALGDAWRASDAPAFKKALIEYGNWLGTKVPDDVARARHEFLFNAYEPFYKSMILYVAVLLLAFLSLLGGSRTLIRSAFYLLVLAFAVHTIGLVARMALQGRPPVTNLYSSAIFVGWAAVLLGIVLERLYRNGLGSMVASAIGFVTLIIAHHLNQQGDTMEMMRAVLDSNFWLATHVVCITIGYSSTFLSGALAALYLIRRLFDREWNEPTAAELERMVYGIVCFSAFFSFLGTILGGIWADQSWGRFWGWDPKENGALMIVLWNVFVLHARLGGLAKQRSVMIMAVFGNIVTAFSWFGVNMLGIGLHSYGFMEKAFVWLVIFAVSQLAVMALGFIPDYATRRHGSHSRRSSS